MRCKYCKQSSSIFLKSFNLFLCDSCFLDFFKRRLRATINTFKMYEPKDTILVAVSGGKDSLVLWDALDDMGYRTHGLHIDMGLGGHSEQSRACVSAFSRQRNLPLTIVSFSDLFKVGISELARKTHQTPCRICGMVRRYIMNREAGQFSCVATGHTLDDESAALLGNILNWQEGFLNRQAPVLPKRLSLAKKIKPLCLTSEDEIIHYAACRNISYFADRCPLSANATSLFYKKVFSDIEKRFPGACLRFYKEFARRRYFKNRIEENLVSCKICGYLTVADICNFCRLREKASQMKQDDLDSTR